MIENAMRYKLFRESEFLTKSASERYIHFKKEYPHLIGTIKQSYIATYLGVNPESLSRIKKNLRERY